MYYNRIEIGSKYYIELSDRDYGPLIEVWVDGVSLPRAIYMIDASTHEICTTKHYFQLANAWNFEGDIIWTYYRDNFENRNGIIPQSHLFRFAKFDYQATLGCDVKSLPKISNLELQKFFREEWTKLFAHTEFISQHGGLPMQPTPPQDWNGARLLSLATSAINRNSIEYWHFKAIQVIASFELEVSTIDDLSGIDQIAIRIVSRIGQLGLIFNDFQEELALKFGTCVVLTNDELSDELTKYLKDNQID